MRGMDVMNDPDPPKPFRAYRPLEQDHKQVHLEQQAKDAKRKVAEAKVRAAMEAAKDRSTQVQTNPPEAPRHEQPYRPAYGFAANPGLAPAPGGMGGTGVYQARRASVESPPETMKDLSDRMRRDSKIPAPKPGQEVTDAQRERQAKDKFRVAVERVARSSERVNANDGNAKDGGKGGIGQ